MTLISILVLSLFGASSSAEPNASANVKSRCAAYVDQAVTAMFDAMVKPRPSTDPVPFLPSSSGGVDALKRDFRRYYNMNSLGYYAQNLTLQTSAIRLAEESINQLLDENVPGWFDNDQIVIVYTAYGEISLYADNHRLPRLFARYTHIILENGLAIGAIVPDRQNRSRYISLK